MSETKPEVRKNCVEFEFDFDEPPQKVWRAISIPEFRERWLPKEALADSEAANIAAGWEISYKLREGLPPFLESIVTFTVAPNAIGGTRLRIVHEPADVRMDRMAKAAANSNIPFVLMLAA